MQLKLYSLNGSDLAQVKGDPLFWTLSGISLASLQVLNIRLQDTASSYKRLNPLCKIPCNEKTERLQENRDPYQNEVRKHCFFKWDESLISSLPTDDILNRPQNIIAAFFSLLHSLKIIVNVFPHPTLYCLNNIRSYKFDIFNNGIKEKSQHKLFIS